MKGERQVGVGTVGAVVEGGIVGVTGGFVGLLVGVALLTFNVKAPKLPKDPSDNFGKKVPRKSVRIARMHVKMRPNMNLKKGELTNIDVTGFTNRGSEADT